jgi:cytochrome c556
MLRLDEKKERSLYAGRPRKRSGRLIFCLSLTAIVFAASVHVVSPVSAAENATGAIKMRADNMQTMARAYKNLLDMFKGDMNYNARYAAGYADALMITSRHIVKWFEDKDMSPPSSSLPAIWTDWDNFVKTSNAATGEARKLHQLIRSKATMKDVLVQFKVVEDACSSCHEAYRKSGGGLQPAPGKAIGTVQ